MSHLLPGDPLVEAFHERGKMIRSYVARVLKLEAALRKIARLRDPSEAATVAKDALNSERAA